MLGYDMGITTRDGEGVAWMIACRNRLGSWLLVLALAVTLGGVWSGAARAAELWTIDPERSEVIYRVDETFLQQVTRATAVGVTRAVEGQIRIDPARLQQMEVSPVRVDISQFKSDQPRRDERIRRQWLESAKYPIAQFVVASVEGLPEQYEAGQAVPVKVHGELTVRETTRPVTWEGVLTLEDGLLKGELETEILMTDFDFDPPSILGVLRADNEVHLTFNFTAVRDQG